ncbi:MAG: hypothetical protein D6744_15530, partial [Planctomycetota bacterium]
ACTECHAVDAPIYFGRLTTSDDAADGGRNLRTMIDLRGDDETLTRTLAASFRWRTLFKWTSLACLSIILIVWLRHAFAGDVARSARALRADAPRHPTRDTEQGASRR